MASSSAVPRLATTSAGRSVSAGGDVNGDGFGDLIIGAYNADPNGPTSRRESYVVFWQSGRVLPPT